MFRNERSSDEEIKEAAKGYITIANTCLPDDIIMKEDTTVDHTNGRIPIIDTEMWMENGQIFHLHYSKLMASMEVLVARSAMSLASRIEILVQEGSRRVRNCSLTMPWEKIVPFLNKLMISMSWGHYPESVRRLVATRIIARRNTNMDNLENLQRPLYRDKATRRRQPKEDKASWFRASGATATIMVPSTPGSGLAKGVRELLQAVPGPLGTSTKVLERPGANIHQGLAPNNPFKRIPTTFALLFEDSPTVTDLLVKQ